MVTRQCEPCEVPAPLSVSVRLSVRLSPAMQAVLRACAASDPEPVWVADLVAEQVQRGAALATVRVSLSRTLRRLWQTGLVDVGVDLDTLPPMTPAAAEWPARRDDPAADRPAGAVRTASGLAVPRRATAQAEGDVRAERDVQVSRVRLTHRGRQWMVTSDPRVRVNRAAPVGPVTED